MDAWILFAHGSRDPEWSRPFDAIAARARALLPDAAVELAFLERQPPSLEAAAADLAARGATRIRVVPLFLGVGGHLTHDLPRLVDAVRARFPSIRVDVTPSVGESATVAEAIAAWIAAMD